MGSGNSKWLLTPNWIGFKKCVPDSLWQLFYVLAPWLGQTSPKAPTDLLPSRREEIHSFNTQKGPSVSGRAFKVLVQVKY